MKKILIAIAIATLPLLSAGAAGAQPKIDKESTEDCNRAKLAGKACVLDFGKGSDVEGGKPTATGSDVETLMAHMFGNLIHYRVDFHAEIVRTAETL